MQIPAKEDLDYMMKSVRALIKIVEEIWSNCKDHRVGTDMKFRQVNFIEATVNKQVGASTSLCITTKEKILVEDFGNPPEMPKKLMNLISAPEKIDDLPDYTSYLKNALTLCDNVLLAFLKSFQYHLKNVQTYLGQIEAWLSEPESVVNFLNEVFGEGVVTIGTINESMCQERQGRTNGNGVCLRCNRVESGPTQNVYGSYPYSNPTSQNRCKMIPARWCLLYTPRIVQLMSSNKALEGGNMNMTFNLSTIDEQEKLKTFVSFLKMFEN